MLLKLWPIGVGIFLSTCGVEKKEETPQIHVLPNVPKLKSYFTALPGDMNIFPETHICERVAVDYSLENYLKTKIKNGIGVSAALSPILNKSNISPFIKGTKVYREHSASKYSRKYYIDDFTKFCSKYEEKTLYIDTYIKLNENKMPYKIETSIRQKNKEWKSVYRLDPDRFIATEADESGKIVGERGEVSAIRNDVYKIGLDFLSFLNQGNGH